MAVYKYVFESGSEYSSARVLLKLDSTTVNVRATVRHFRRTDKWYLSLFNVVTGDPILTYIPMESCTGKTYYNLLAQYGYKDLGAVAVVANNASNNHIDPNGSDLSLWSMLWGD